MNSFSALTVPPSKRILKAPVSHMRKRNMSDAYKHRRYYDPQVTVDSLAHLNDDYERYMHLLQPCAFDSVKKAEAYKMTADAALPWGNGRWGDSHTLWGHTIQEGMAQGFNGFMGYPALSLLRQNGLINACISTTADEMTRNFIQFLRNGEADADDEDIKRLDDAFKEMNIQGLFNEVIRFNELMGGLFIYIDTGATDDELLYPLFINERSAELQRFKRFTLVEPINCFPGVYESTNPLSPIYFEPQYWWVLGKRVHHSRLIKVCSGNTPLLLKAAYNFLGVPHAQILWDYVIHFNRNRIASTKLLERFSREVLSTNMIDLMTQDGGRETVKARARDLSDTNIFGVTVIDNEMEEIIKVETSLAGVKDIVSQQLEFIPVANASPAVKTLGISPSGFSTGDTDIENWEQHIGSKQHRDVGPAIEKVVTITKIVKLGKNDPSLGWEFLPLSEEKFEQVASYNRLIISALNDAFASGGISEEEYRLALKSFPRSILRGIDTDLPLDDLATPRGKFRLNEVDEVRENINQKI